MKRKKESIPYKDSYKIVADEIRRFWKERHFAEPVIAFFYQKYDYKDKWEWHEEIAEDNATDDYESVTFLYDFCEGQTCVKDVAIVPLDRVTEYYTENAIKKDGVE